MAEPARRRYRQVARATSAEATADRILDAAIALFWESPATSASLEAVADRAGVSVQTVIRRFGGRDGLFAAAVARESARVGAERDPGSVRSTAGAIRQLVDHYEARGDAVIRLLAEETRIPALAEVAEGGRRFHRDWCAAVFASALDPLGRSVRERRLAQLVAVCDVYTWKLLRRDSGLSRRATEQAMLELVEPLLEGS